ncbi:hypothetical protein BDW71DRAFT_177993 [Aspergillus fruticulosus]
MSLWLSLKPDARSSTNSNVNYVEGYSLAFGTDINWAYEPENQIYAGGLKQTIRAGKATGGTSSINGIQPKTYKSTSGNWSETKNGTGRAFSHTTRSQKISRCPLKNKLRMATLTTPMTIGRTAPCRWIGPQQ